MLQALAAQAQDTIERAYEDQRRMLLAAEFARVFLVVLGISFVGIVVAAFAAVPFPPAWESDRGKFVVFNCLLIVLTMGLCGAALAGEWLRQGALTTWSLVGACFCGALGFNVLWSRGSLTPFTVIGLLALLAPTVVTGLIRGIRAIIFVTGASVLFTFVFLVRAAMQSPELGRDASLGLAPVLLLFHVAMAALMITAVRSLRHTIHELGDVRAAVDRAERLDDLKDQFIASVNHELRNPLMTLQAYLQMLEAKGQELDPARRQQMVVKANRVADSVVALLESILDARRGDLESKEFSLDTVTILPVVQTAISLLDPREGVLGDREVRFDIPDDLTVWAEPIRLQQIVTNLVSNAIKYSARGSPIIVTAAPVFESVAESGLFRRASVERRMIEMTVRDFGLGIPPQQQDLLFQRFVRLPRDLASNVIGNGLGLYLCRVLAEMMRGRIWVESTGIPGEGATFHLRLLPPPSVPVMEPRLVPQAVVPETAQ